MAVAKTVSVQELIEMLEKVPEQDRKSRKVKFRCGPTGGERGVVSVYFDGQRQVVELTSSPI